MKRTMVIGLVVAVGLVLTGAAYACWWGGYGMPYDTSANAQTLNKFQRETLQLRDELSARQLDLQNEYDKPAPDANRVATLQKEIVDLEARIGTASDKYGVSRYGGRGYGPGYGMYGGSWDHMGYAPRGRGMYGCW